MIVILKENPNPKQLTNLKNWITSQGITIHESQGVHQLILGLVGDTTGIDIDLIKALDIVEDVKRIQDPYKNVNRKFHPLDTVVDINGLKIGGGNFQIIAGPCSIESEEISQLDLFADVDVIQVGARNMQNFELLKKLGTTNKPILLKRGLANTIQELLMSAEYIMAGGNPNIILCERGIRTFETATRNTLDISAIPVIKNLSHLPIVIDPSHATGIARLVPTMSLAATAAGADGLIIEVHNDPEHALCDGPQSLLPETFAKLVKKIEKVRAAIA